LDEYRRLSSAAESAHVDELLAEVANFRATIDSVLGRGATTNDPRSVLTSRVAPAREAVMRASEDARAENRSAFVEQQSSIPGIVGGVHRQALTQLGFALAASFGIALLATVYASRLESRLVQKKLDLQQLSAKVIHAQEEERRTIARELHDEIGQAMSAVKVELAVAQTRVEQVGASVGLLDDAQAIADTALRTVRDLSHLLHPGILDDLGLAAALDWYIRGFSRRNRIPVALDCAIGDGRLVPNIEANVYRIVQEALTNVARHSRATDCRVSVRSSQGKLVVTVEDNGVGFDPDGLERRTAERGLGLIGIRERAGELLGIVRIDSTPGNGTRLTVELPSRARHADTSREQEVIHA
jgi:signal transduction histidine kinase